jgi:hypothetical protein
MATEFTFAKTPCRPDVLQQEAVAAGIPVLHVNGAGEVITVFTTRDLTLPEEDTLDAVVFAHDGRPRQKRLVYDILVDVNALTNQQKVAIWADLMSGDPPKLYLDAGPNLGAIIALDFSAQIPATITATEKNIAKARVISLYTHDVDAYLVHPPFDPTIDVPSTEPVP